MGKCIAKRVGEERPKKCYNNNNVKNIHKRHTQKNECVLLSLMHIQMCIQKACGTIFPKRSYVLVNLCIKHSWKFEPENEYAKAEKNEQIQRKKYLMHAAEIKAARIWNVP